MKLVRPSERKKEEEEEEEEEEEYNLEKFEMNDKRIQPCGYLFGD